MRDDAVEAPGREESVLRRVGSLERGAPIGLVGSANEAQAVGDELRKKVRVSEDDDANDGREGHGMPKNVAEDRTFVADLVGGGGGHADRLCVDHFAHHTTGAVGGTHQDGTQMELLGGDAL